MADKKPTYQELAEQVKTLTVYAVGLEQQCAGLALKLQIAEDQIRKLTKPAQRVLDPKAASPYDRPA